MKAKTYPSPKRLYYFIVFFLLLISESQIATAQSTAKGTTDFDKLAQAYHSNNISAEQYFIKADSLTHQLLSEGKHFKTKELVSLLSLYEEIAWSKPKYSRARVSYFFLFFNNARMFKQNGASMYYAEKVSEEYKKYGQKHPLVDQLQKCKIYQELRLYDKIIALFNEEKSYLMRLPELLKYGQVDNSIGLNALYILSPVLTGYVRQNDTASVRETALLARQISKALQHTDSLRRSQMLYNDLLMIDIEHSVANFEHRYDSARILLNRMETLKTTYQDQATNFIDINLIRFRIENYLNLKDQDSLRSYIAKYEAFPSFGKSQNADVAEFKAKLKILQGDYKEGYSLLTDALKIERDLQADLMKESSDLLYAFTQAEHSNIALQRAEKAKWQRSLWLIIVSSSAVLIVLVIYLIMIYRERKAKAQIAVLNDMANLQIIAMEEAKHQAVKEEQQRLGQDLHDGLSSSIAAIRHQLEVLSMDAEDTVLKNKLSKLQAETAHAYEVARRKSHEWFSAADEQQEPSFEKRIRLLTDNSLPDNRYNKTIYIDDNSLVNVGMDTYIALLRIIQEAITNIIKHAKAKNVSILIYEEAGNLILTISDDGIGLGEKKSPIKKSSLGLESIRRRVEYLNGETSVNSNTEGTEITVTIPIGSSYAQAN